jgi:hypothetical protein
MSDEKELELDQNPGKGKGLGRGKDQDKDKEQDSEDDQNPGKGRAKKTVSQDGNVTVIETVKESFWKITSMDFLFLEISLGLILYPGVSAYITGTQKDSLPSYSQAMLKFSEVDAKEYREKIKSQGILGVA